MDSIPSEARLSKHLDEIFPKAGLHELARSQRPFSRRDRRPRVVYTCVCCYYLRKLLRGGSLAHVPVILHNKIDAGILHPVHTCTSTVLF